MRKTPRLAVEFGWSLYLEFEIIHDLRAKRCAAISRVLHYLAHRLVSGIDALRDHIAPGAFHNSSERGDPPKCHPRTRLAINQAIVDWIEDGQRTCFIKWLYGSAGSGKSAIAQTIAEMYHESRRLAASFFWSRMAARRNSEEWLVASLAYQLGVFFPDMLDHIEQAVERDPSIFSRSLDAEMGSLSSNH